MSNLSVLLTAKIKYRKPLKKHRKVTCIIGGKCKDGVVLVAEKKSGTLTQTLLSIGKNYSFFRRIIFIILLSWALLAQDRCMKNSKEMPSIHYKRLVPTLH